jgi:flagellin
MGLRINTNLTSLTAQRNLFAAGLQVNKSLGRLGSGLRIQRAADDAAGLAMSERMNMHSRSWGQVERNISDGVGLANYVEGIYSEVGDMVARLRELATHSMTGTLSDADRVSLQIEAEQIIAEVDRIADGTHYNGLSGIPIGDGSIFRVPIQVGINADDFVYVRLTSLQPDSLQIDTVDLSTQAGAEAALAGIDTGIQRLARGRGKIGADLHVLASAGANASVTRSGLESAKSRIRDVDIASESAQLLKAQLIQEMATKILAQANIQPQLALKLLQ